MKKALLLSLYCCLSLALWSQDEVTLTGKVTDKQNKEALLGATILVKGKGTVTDLDGNYSLTLAMPHKSWRYNSLARP
jgi:CarboxypepD_reg-like domain